MLLYVTVDNGKVTGFSQVNNPGSIPYDAPYEFMNKWYNYIYRDGQFIVDDYEVAIIKDRKDKFDAKDFLDRTDWKVLRHMEQKYLGIATSLTEDEYTQLLNKRRQARLLLSDLLK